MIKVSLKKNLRRFEEDDFMIREGETKELNIKFLKVYEVKAALFTGKLLVEEGEFLMNYKGSKLLFVANEKYMVYGVEFNEFFEKDMKTEELTFIKNMPEEYKEKLLAEVKKAEEVKAKEDKEATDTENKKLDEAKADALPNEVDEKKEEVDEKEEEVDEKEEEVDEKEEEVVNYTYESLKKLNREGQEKILLEMGYEKNVLRRNKEDGLIELILNNK